MVHTKYSFALGLALSLGIVAAPTKSQFIASAVAQPVSQGTTNVRIDGSSSMTAVNKVLKQGFEKTNTGSQVTVSERGGAEGLKAVADGQADLAALGRPLTQQEKAAGFKAVSVGRGKIAILVGADNPYAKSLTIPQFAKIFRGEVKNWSEVGGASVPIRFVDRPETSDTRQAFQSYPAFKGAPLTTGDTAERLDQDTIDAVAQKLGKDGISYSLANLVSDQPGVKAVTMHNTPPTDPRYPFSQSLYYAYKGDPNPAVKAFLGYATTPETRSQLKQSAAIEGAANAAAFSPGTASSSATTSAGNTTQSTTTQKSDAQKSDSATPAVSPTVDSSPATSPADSSSTTTAQAPSVATGGDVATEGGGSNWWWWLLPIASGAGLLWYLGKRRQPAAVVGPTEDYDLSRSRRVDPGFDTGGYSVPDTTPDLPRRTGIDLPTPELPNINRPNVDLPDINLPDANLPNVNLPDANLPNVSLPDVNAPNLGGAVNTGRDWLGNVANMGGAAVAGGAAMAAGAGAAAWSTLRGRGDGRSRITLRTGDAQTVEADWDISASDRETSQSLGGNRQALRLYDVTDIDLEQQEPHSVQQFECEGVNNSQRLSIQTPDRDYLAEVGYQTPNGDWLAVARSTHVRVSSSSGGSNVMGNIAKAGGAAVAGGAAMAGGAMDSARSFVLGDGEPTEIQDPRTEVSWDTASESTPGTQPSTPNWLEQTSQSAANTVSDATQAGGAAIAGGAAAAGAAGAAAWSFLSGQQSGQQSDQQSSQQSGQQNLGATADATNTRINQSETMLQGDVTTPQLDVTLGRLVLTPRNSQWAYAYWDIPRIQRARLDQQPGQNLTMRLYDVTDLDIQRQLPEPVEHFDIDDMALSCDVPIPVSNRTYLAEIGYLDANNRWVQLAQSAPAWIAGS